MRFLFFRDSCLRSVDGLGLAWVKKDTEEVIGVITDYVDPAYVPPSLSPLRVTLTVCLQIEQVHRGRRHRLLYVPRSPATLRTFLIRGMELTNVNATGDIPPVPTKCGYACSE